MIFRRKSEPPAPIILSMDEIDLMRFDRESRGILEWSNQLSGREMALVRGYRIRKAAEAVEAGRKAVEAAKQYEWQRRHPPRVIEPSPPEELSESEVGKPLAGRLKPEALAAWIKAKALRRENPNRPLSWERVSEDSGVGGYNERHLRRWAKWEEEITGQKP
jgi:hypothetical protein